jgi:hypothetical protein
VRVNRSLKYDGRSLIGTARRVHYVYERYDRISRRGR